MRTVSKKLFSIFLVLSLLLGLGPKRVLRGEGLGATTLYHDSVSRTFDVWDFGGEQFSSFGNHTYNNKLNIDLINAQFDSEPGTKGVSITNDLVFFGNDGHEELAFRTGGKNNHRLRTINKGITRYDEKEKKNSADSSMIYDGFIYSNAGKNPDVRFEIDVKAGDRFIWAIGSNGGDSNIVWESPSGIKEERLFTSGSQAEEMLFYAKETGTYKLYSADEKLVVARILRQSAPTVSLSGRISGAEALANQTYNILLTNRETGETTTAQVENNRFTVDIYSTYSYDLALEGADGYYIESPAEVQLTDENQSVSIKLAKAELIDVEGSLLGLDEKTLGRVKLNLWTDSPYKPEVVYDPESGHYKATVEVNQSYTLEVSGADDYLLDEETISFADAGNYDLNFAPKPTHRLDLTVEGIDDRDLSNLQLQFQRLSDSDETVEEDYIYTFQATDEIQLRSGRYRLVAPFTGYNLEPVDTIEITDASTTLHLIYRKDVSPRQWHYAAFGSGVDTKNNGFEGALENGLTLFSQSGKGKIVPASTDGLAFYYTTINPHTENFTLSADVEVLEWTYSNGQEGFGLMAADRVGEDGNNGSFWNNSYMNVISKVEYNWDKAEGKVSNVGDKYAMRLGPGSQEKTGVTPENLADGTTAGVFKSTMLPLDTSLARNAMAPATYNLVGNCTNGTGFPDYNPQTTFRLTIERNNTGYFLSYTDPTGHEITNKYYRDGQDALTVLDPSNIYVGFFASRNAKIKISNVTFETIHPAEDAPAEERPMETVEPHYTIESASTANNPSYDLVFYGNADGLLSVEDALTGRTLAKDLVVKAGTKVRHNLTLQEGSNTFKVTFTPDPEFKVDEYTVLSTYESKTFIHNVFLVDQGRDVVYIGPAGTKEADGSRQNPVDIYTAINQAIPGQKLVLLEGRYLLDKAVQMERGMDGEAGNEIILMADPGASSRPVLDFQEKSAGLVLGSSYWVLQGFDVTRTAAGQKGVQVSGHYNLLDNLHTYRNGNTGVQISRLMGSDTREEWPSHNLVLNCTSYLNADPGYEDADGFAAKLTIGEGNVFDGCIAAYNADDGWDLFAKVETGPIGKVVIKNSVAYKNGYDLGPDGEEIVAGNGNGFKMGGSSITGYHELHNSISFANRAKGIDSNSCPDIQVWNSTAYNNEAYNVAFYTNDVNTTDFGAQGILSYKDSNQVAEQIRFKDGQDPAKVLGDSNYYFNFFDQTNQSRNQSGDVVTAEWFVNLDMEKAIHGGISRNADGSINMKGFLEPSNLAAEHTGARLGRTPSPVFDLPEALLWEETGEDGWTPGDGDFVLKANGDLEDLLLVRFGDQILYSKEEASPYETSDYRLEKGSTILTLKEAFLKKQEPGDYSLTMTFASGETVEEGTLSFMMGIAPGTLESTDASTSGTSASEVMPTKSSRVDKETVMTGDNEAVVTGDRSLAIIGLGVGITLLALAALVVRRREGDEV